MAVDGLVLGIFDGRIEKDILRDVLRGEVPASKLEAMVILSLLPVKHYPPERVIRELARFLVKKKIALVSYFEDVGSGFNPRVEITLYGVGFDDRWVPVRLYKLSIVKDDMQSGHTHGHGDGWYYKIESVRLGDVEALQRFLNRGSGRESCNIIMPAVPV